MTMGNPNKTDLNRQLTLSLPKEMEREIAIIGTNRLIILLGTAIYRQATGKAIYPEEFL